MPKPDFDPERWRERVRAQDVVFASFERLRQIRTDHQFKAFVWPDEGGFGGDGTWTFNEAHRDAFEPLLIDPTSASAMIVVHDTLNPKNQARFERLMAEDRGWFGMLFEFSWEHVRFGRAA